MTRKRYLYILMALLGLLVACDESNNETTEVSTDATISKLSFVANDSFPNLSKATFTIEDLADTGRIYNPDSLDFGTCLDTIRCYFTFSSSSVGAATVYTAHDTVSITGTDIINFSDTPVRIKVTAADLKTTKWYTIDVRVHHSDPDVYRWQELTSSISADAEGEQKAFRANEMFYMMVNDGLQNRLFASSNAVSWIAKGNVAQLPADCYVRQMVSHKNQLFYADDKTMYALNPASLQVTKQAISPDTCQLYTLLFSFNDSLWSVMQNVSDNSLYLASSADGFSWRVKYETILPSSFPVRDFATDTFTIMSGRPCAIILGGWDANGKFNNTQYNVEYSPDGYRVTYFEQRTTLPLIGASFVQYGKNKNHFLLRMMNNMFHHLINLYQYIVNHQK